MIDQGVVNVPAGQRCKFTPAGLIGHGGAAESFAANGVEVLISEQRQVVDLDPLLDDLLDEVQVIGGQFTLIPS